MGVFAALGRSGRTLVSPWLVVIVPFLACLPREDLASYSESTVGGGGASQGPSAAGSSGSDAGPEPTGGQAGESNPGDLPLDPDGMGSLAAADASTASDAGSELPDATSTLDAGALVDAGAANQCAANQGTVVPGGDACLIFVAQARVSWQAAALACQTRNASLVSVKTLERDQFLSSLIDTEIWLGAFDPGTNAAANAFVWRDQTAVDTNMATWAAMEPDGVADQFCVSKSPPAMGGQWRDRPCTELRAYVCEQPL